MKLTLAAGQYQLTFEDWKVQLERLGDKLAEWTDPPVCIHCRSGYHHVCRSDQLYTFEHDNALVITDPSCSCLWNGHWSNH